MANRRASGGTRYGMTAPDFVTGKSADRGALAGAGGLLLIGVGSHPEQQDGTEQWDEKQAAHCDSPVMGCLLQRRSTTVVASHPAHFASIPLSLPSEGGLALLPRWIQQHLAVRVWPAQCLKYIRQL